MVIAELGGEMMHSLNKNAVPHGKFNHRNNNKEGTDR